MSIENDELWAERIARSELEQLKERETALTALLQEWASTYNHPAHPLSRKTRDLLARYARRK